MVRHSRRPRELRNGHSSLQGNERNGTRPTGALLMSERKQHHERIRALNDNLRRQGPQNTPSVRWVLTRGVLELGTMFVAKAIQSVQTFDAFDADNDPHREHDFGGFSVGETRLFWKIDYYDRSLDGGSPDPSDEAVTCRVLTIMLTLEY